MLHVNFCTFVLLLSTVQPSLIRLRRAPASALLTELLGRRALSLYRANGRGRFGGQTEAAPRPSLFRGVRQFVKCTFSSLNFVKEFRRFLG